MYKWLCSNLFVERHNNIYKKLYRWNRTKGTEVLNIVKIVLDVMSPAQQSIVDLVGTLSKIEGLNQVDITLSELEKNVEDFKVTLEGSNLNYENIRSAIKDFGGVIRNVDNVVSAQHHPPKNNNDKLSASMLVLARHSGSNFDNNIEQIYGEFEKTLEYIQSKKR